MRLEVFTLVEIWVVVFWVVMWVMTSILEKLIAGLFRASSRFALRRCYAPTVPLGVITRKVAIQIQNCEVTGGWRRLDNLYYLLNVISLILKSRRIRQL
jgi:hypothetical protein